MRLSPSAHLDTFCRDRLPAPDQWPEFRFDLPELHYPERLNCAVELLDATAARDGADRPCLHSAAGTGAGGTGAGGTGAGRNRGWRNRGWRNRAERNLDLRRGRPPH